MPGDQGALRAGDVVARRFEVERLAGAGGMGEVYRARDQISGDPVALKILHAHSPVHAERFTREAQLLAELTHPGIVRYVAHGTSGASRPFIAMEWLEGKTLAERLAHEGVTVAETVALGRRVAQALAEAHRRGVVHRDLKPGNLFLVGGAMERVKVLDFGIARVSDAETMLTRTGAMLGTPGYMSPEQARGEREVDARADVFALGCVLFKCLTGRRAFEGQDAMAVLLKVVLEDAPRVRTLAPSVPADLEDVLARMLAKSRDDRPPDGAAVADALGAIGRVPEGQAPESTATPSLGTSERRAMCLVLARLGAGPGVLDSDVATVSPAELAASRDALVAAVEALGERLELLADGSMLVPIASAGAPTDQAARAARCALAIVATAPIARVAVVSGRAVLAGLVPLGEIIDRAARLQAEARPGAIRIDELTAGLLGAELDVGGDERGLVLRGRREVAESRRTLLGKPIACVGRERELAALESFFDECVSEPMARPVLVTGPAGIGKSMLRDELLRRLRTRAGEALAWVGRGDPVSGGSPFGLIAPALRHAAGVREGEPLEVRRRKVRARVARHVAEADVQRVAEFLGELMGVRFPDQDSLQLRTARQDAVLMSDQTRRAWEDLLAAETAHHPVLLVLEDLHWGDLPTVQLVDGALRLLRRRPLMVLALARPDVHELFPKLWEAREVQEIRLGGLSPRGGERLVRQVLGDAPSDATVAALVERSGGNAFYLEELVRASAEGRGDGLPETVLAMAQARLERLDPEARRILRAASVFGQVFRGSAVTALLGGDANTGQLSEWLGVLVEQEVVTPRGDAKLGEQELAFRHALVRDAAYAMLTDADRSLGHRLAAEWLEREGEDDAMVLAEHFERGGLGERAAAWYARAAEQAFQANDLAAVHARAERGVACGAAGEVLGALRLVQAQALRWRGHKADGETRAREALACLPAGSARWFAAMSEALLAAGALGGRERLVELYREVVAASPVEGAEDARLRAIARAATQLTLSGEASLADEALAVLPGLGANEQRDPTVSALADRARAWRQLYAGDVGRHLELILAALAALEGVGDRQSACASRVNAGYAYMLLGDYDQAERYLVEATEVGRAIGSESTVATAQHNLGLVLARKGRVAEGLAVERGARDRFRAMGNQRFEAASSTYLAAIRLLAGAPRDAAEDAASAVAMLATSPPLRAHALATLACARLAFDVPSALEAAREAVELVESAGVLAEAEPLCRLAYAECLRAAGQEAEARDAIATARDSLLARAARIADASWRRSFLERVPENARTLELARAWLGD